MWAHEENYHVARLENRMESNVIEILYNGPTLSGNQILRCENCCNSIFIVVLSEFYKHTEIFATDDC
jgi:hypothetical protein